MKDIGEDLPSVFNKEKHEVWRIHMGVYEIMSSSVLPVLQGKVLDVEWFLL